MAAYCVRCLLCLVLLLPLSSRATEAPTIEEAATLDVATTLVGLSRGARETNPLGLIGGTAVKLLTIPYVNSLENEANRKNAQNFASSLWTAASVNNIGVILGMPPIITISAAIITYIELRK